MALKMRFNKTAPWPATRGRGAPETRPIANAKWLILCVDDEPDALTILRLFLCAKGFEVTVASDVAEALRLVESRRPDLVITDYAMPGMSGLDLCRALRGLVATHDIPIILHSGVELRTEHADLFDRFLLKPTELDLLAREICRLLPANPAQKSA